MRAHSLFCVALLVLQRDQVPAGEGAKGRVYIDGKSIVPTSDKLYYRTKWATPDGRMTKNPSFLVRRKGAGG